jgi:type III secretion protein U
MADDQNSGDRTEEPTPRRLADARKRGEVSKSREVGATAGLLAALAIGSLMLGWAGDQLAALIELAIASIGQPFAYAAPALARASVWALLSIVLAFAVPVALISLLADFLQIGPVFSTEPFAPKLERLDLVAGLRRMFGAENLVELAKSLLKTAVIGLIAWLVVREIFAKSTSLVHGAAPALGEALRVSTFHLLGWTVAIFSVVTMVDVLYQRYAFRKRMRMTPSEVKREHKEDEGDPLLKQKRKQLHQEWSERNAISSAQSANVLVMNPTHVAIALDYDPETAPVPVVSGKGEDDLAMEMRDHARMAGVPVLRDIALARALLERAEIGAVVPDDLFDAVAQAIVWARGVREKERAERVDGSAAAKRRGRGNAAAGQGANEADIATAAATRAPAAPPAPRQPPRGR